MENVMVYEKTKSVFSNERRLSEKNENPILINKKIKVNQKNEMDGLKMLKGINENVISASFFDPQYRGIMDKMSYGNEGEGRQKERSELLQMTDDIIMSFIGEINRVLQPSGHLFLWIDKFHLCEGTSHWFENTSLTVVDLITWNKGKIGMGYRTRRLSEYLLVLQKEPKRAKGVWTNHSIPDTWDEKVIGKIHPHQKPLHLQRELIKSVTAPNDYVIDPCAGSYSVLEACSLIDRNFIGCDIKTV